VPEQGLDSAVGTNGIRTRGIQHVHLIVEDLERSLSFYRAAFGLTEAFRVGDNMVFLDVPDTSDVLVLHQLAVDEGSASGVKHGVDHFGLRLVDPDDLDEAIAIVSDAGGRLVERGAHAGRFPYAYVSDPDGNLIEL